MSENNASLMRRRRATAAPQHPYDKGDIDGSSCWEPTMPYRRRDMPMNDRKVCCQHVSTINVVVRQDVARNVTLNGRALIIQQLRVIRLSPRRRKLRYWVKACSRGTGNVR